MLKTNLFPLKDSLYPVRSHYIHSNASDYTRFLNNKGFLAFQEDNHVVVYHHGSENPDKNRKPFKQQYLTVNSSLKEYKRGVNAIIYNLFKKSGFLKIEQKQEFISITKNVVSLIIAERGKNLPQLNVRGHLRWEWDLELYNNSLWLIPILGRRFLTAQDPSFTPLNNLLKKRLADNKKIKGIDLKSGNHRQFFFQRSCWGINTSKGFEPLTSTDWRVSLDMKLLKDLGYSTDAFHSAQFSFEEMIKAVKNSSPFEIVLKSTDPYISDEKNSGFVDGKHLRFRNGLGREMIEIRKLGILEPPPKPVELIPVISEKATEEEGKKINLILGAHFINRSKLINHTEGKNYLASVGAGDGRDTISTIWSTGGKYKYGFNLLPFSIPKPSIAYYDKNSGMIIDSKGLKEHLKIANQRKTTLIALVLLEDDLEKPEHDRLMREFVGMKAFPFLASQLHKAKGALPTWINLTLALSMKAGAVPWDLFNLPGVNDHTVFVGIDLGHNHKNNTSTIAFTLFDNHGRPIGRSIVNREENNERIPFEVFRDDLTNLLFDRNAEPPRQIIVHRDGRFLDGEVDDLMFILQNCLSLTLVSIKKDSFIRFDDQQPEGEFFKLDKKRIMILTNNQSKNFSVPRPLEIELIHSDHLDLTQVVSQVFWLTRVCQGNAYHSKRLPVTTGLANNIAATGKSIFLNGWEYHDD